MPGKIFSKRLQADLALGLAALIWGATFVLVKDALADVSVFVYLAVRFALAAAVMALFFWRSLRGLTLASSGPARKSDFSCSPATPSRPLA